MQDDKADTALLLNNQMCFALYATSRAITKKYAELLADLGLTYPQYLTLLALWEHDGKGVHELAQKLEIEGATMTPLLQRMEKLGFVTRKRGTEDERRVNVFLTEKGKALRAKALSVPSALGCAMGVDDAQAQAVIFELSKIRASLQ